MAYTRAQKKAVIVARTKRRLEHRLADIDWELDELAPAIKKIGELEMQHNVEIEAGEMDENSLEPEEDPGL